MHFQVGDLVRFHNRHDRYYNLHGQVIGLGNSGGYLTIAIYSRKAPVQPAFIQKARCLLVARVIKGPILT